MADKESGKDATHFTVVTHQRKYHFKADSTPSAKEWVKALQKIIFRSHNDGDSVKISLPIENIIDVEESQIIGFADTCKIRVIDNDETYAIDEVRKCHRSLNAPVSNTRTTVLFFLFQLRKGSIKCAQDLSRRHYGSNSSRGVAATAYNRWECQSSWKWV